MPTAKMRYRKKQEARYKAFESIVRLIGETNGGMTTTFPYYSNRFVNEEDKELFRREVEKLTHQLASRSQKLYERLYQ